MIPSYPKVWAIGHRKIASIWEGRVLIQEKVDGSQFSFGLIDGNLYMRSKGAPVYLEDYQKLFEPAVKTVKRLLYSGLLPDNTIFRAEAFRGPKHNTLEYARMPKGGLVLFDISTYEPDFKIETYITDYDLLKDFADTFDIDCVPVLFDGGVYSIDTVKDLLQTESFLGGVKVEGIVAKNYDKFGDDGKPLFGKYVSEKFKEKHRVRSKQFGEPVNRAAATIVSDALRTEARWEKAVLHLAEAGLLEHSPRDIGRIIAEVKRDIQEEEEEWIKEQLYKIFRPHILRKSTQGLAEWYKEKLLNESFPNPQATSEH